MSMPASASGAVKEEEALSEESNASPPAVSPNNAALNDLSAQSASIGSEAGTMSGQILAGTLPNLQNIASRRLAEIKDLLAAIQVMATTLQTIFGLAKCDVMERMAEQARVDVCQHMLRDLHFITVWEQWALFLMIISFFMNCIFLMLLYLPRRRWVCLEDRFRFRFKASLVAHRNVSLSEDVRTFHVPVSWSDLAGEDRCLQNELKQALRSDLFDIVERLGTTFGCE
jgi:hypothetical protein